MQQCHKWGKALRPARSGGRKIATLWPHGPCTFQCYADSLFSYAYFRVQDKGLAEELVQETFVAALAAREEFKGESSEKTWFVAILKNKIMDQLRRKYREKLQSLESIPEYVAGDFF